MNRQIDTAAVLPARTRSQAAAVTKPATAETDPAVVVSKPAAVATPSETSAALKTGVGKIAQARSSEQAPSRDGQKADERVEPVSGRTRSHTGAAASRPTKSAQRARGWKM